MKKQRKKILLIAVAMLSGIGVFAQGNGAAGITEATQMVTSYFDPATKLIYAIGAVVGLIGGVKVYNKFSSGDPDIDNEKVGKTLLDIGFLSYLLIGSDVDNFRKAIDRVVNGFN